ncbi:MAG: RICIN domain-containing protein [Psychroserpens sp.]|uniref:RICIN domain-containing protein n=1 Tax=Psychroserpens sp. TaxID=2020870 RepID=UPI003C7891AE
MRKYLTIQILTLLLLALSHPAHAQRDGETYYLETALTNKFLDVQWAKDTNGTPLHLWPFNGQIAQQFTLESSGDGYFYIKSTLGKYIHVQNRSNQPRALAHIWEGKGNDNTKWSLIPASDGYHFIRSKKGTYLDVKEAKSKDGTLIWLWNFNGGKGQQWKFTKVASQHIQKPEPTFEQATSGRIEYTTETVNLNDVTNLCPNVLVGGDFEFGGNGPHVFGNIALVRSENNKEIMAHIYFNAKETKSDRLTGKSEVKGSWKIAVYKAPFGQYINGITDFGNTNTTFDKVLKGGGANELFGGGKDGSAHMLTINDGLDDKGFVSSFEVVGDTGGWDISTDNNCENDTRIVKIKFKPVQIELIRAQN